MNSRPTIRYANSMNRRRSLITALLIFVISAALFSPQLNSVAQSSPSPQVYWGGWLDGDQYNGLGDAPWIDQTIDIFENNAGKRLSILHWGQPWHWGSQAGYRGLGDGYFQWFEAANFEKVRQRGTIPMINWNSWDLSNTSTDNPDYQLIDILNGDFDAYIAQWARDAASWGKPFFLRFNHEMNGDWFPWSEQVNGNQRGEYARAWRHVHDIFVREGATNATWVWAVNVEYASNPESSNLENYYPGDAYVDWVAIDGYNWGIRGDVWQSFSEVFGQTYNHLLQIAPSKPVMIAEFGSTEDGGSKAEWLTDALVHQIPSNFPQIKAIVYFNRNADGMDWISETSFASQNAFAKGIASSFYSSNEFSDLSISPIPPLSSLRDSSPTPPADEWLASAQKSYLPILLYRTDN
jgi:hypothetical protein